MQVKTISENNGVRTYQVKIKFTKSMLESEDIIQNSLNDLGTVATKDLLETFDAEGMTSH